MLLFLLAACPLPTDTGKPADPEDDDLETEDGECRWDCEDSAVVVEETGDVSIDTAWVPADTGVAQAYWYGSVETDGVSLFGGGLGFAYLSLRTGNWLCIDATVWDGGAPGPTGCPGCEWSFDPAVVGSSADGPLCTYFGRYDEDIAWDYPVGYASTYDFDGYWVERAVFFYIGSSYGWYLLFYNTGADTWVEGTPEDLTLTRPVPGGIYYYYSSY